ncbi:GNAT family N-acetyltransferase [Sphingosinicella sp. CPCC 101087]|uniref:GNAT family N-acetyltransferase n=1 Tax=Sphingosinicella sp. CPCC 101087 TaxID=2497754 RepID=UPI00101C2673|nr:GNAT family N-acetyltransferase [Sphingosinicella sp. CPCC 101087]
MVIVAPLRSDDCAEWEVLARGYKDFYRDPRPDEDYRRTWDRLMAGGDVHGLGAKVDGRLAGIAHYLFHPTVWLGESCYLQDLFTAPDARGRGVARALIEAVADAARSRGASRYYWLTAQDNRTARSLYDKVARFKGFVRYEYELVGSGRDS